MNTEDAKFDPVLWAGVLGLCGAVFVGIGESLLQFTPNGGITDMTDYAFFNDVSSARLRAGHFIAILGAPLYLVGYWHIFEMLKPAGKKLACLTFLAGAYSFIVGAVWIGQRAFLGETVHAIADGQASAELLHIFSGLNEPLVNVLRLSILLVSIIWMVQIFRGKTHYPKWMIAAAPVLILGIIFVLSLNWKTAEVYLLPAAMNVTHFIVFGLSLMVWLNRRHLLSN